MCGERLLTQDEPFVPGLILLDIGLGAMSGVAVFDDLRRRGSKLPDVFMTALAEVHLAVEQMRRALSTSSRSPWKKSGSSKPSRRRASAAERPMRSRRASGTGGCLVTTRALGIVRPARLDLSNREIGERSGISERTVEAHRRMICRPINAHALEDLRRAAKMADGESGPVF